MLKKKRLKVHCLFHIFRLSISILSSGPIHAFATCSPNKYLKDQNVFKRPGPTKIIIPNGPHCVVFAKQKLSTAPTCIAICNCRCNKYTRIATCQPEYQLSIQIHALSFSLRLAIWLIFLIYFWYKKKVRDFRFL